MLSVTFSITVYSLVAEGFESLDNEIIAILMANLRILVLCELLWMLVGLRLYRGEDRFWW